MKIIKMGTFDKTGYPINWYIDPYADNEKHIEKYCLAIYDDVVYIGGIEMMELTRERKQIMNRTD